MSLLLFFGGGSGGGGGGSGTPIGLLLTLTVTGTPTPTPTPTPTIGGGAFYPTKREIARNKVRQRQIGSLFATPLSWLDKPKTKEERVELLEELEEAVQEAIDEVAASPRPVEIPAVPAIDWVAVAQRKKDFEQVAKSLDDMLR